MKQRYLYLLIIVVAAIMIPVLYFGYLKSEKPSMLTDAVGVPDYMRMCQIDDDCTYVETLCSSCCGSVGINKTYQDQYYDNEFNPACAGYQGAICKCVGPTVPICRSGLCEVVFAEAQTDISDGSTLLTEGWQTYRNEEYGFELQYPASWTLGIPFNIPGNESVEFAAFDQRIETEGFDVGSSIPPSLTIEVFNEDEYTPTAPERFIAAFAEEKSKESYEVSIAGTTVNQITYEHFAVEAAYAVTHQIALPSSDQIYLIRYSYTRAGYGDAGVNERFVKVTEDVWSNIIATFEFTESAKGWQTYRNDEFGFSLSYPAEWSIYSDRVEGQTQIIQVVSPIDTNRNEGTTFLGPSVDIRIPAERAEGGDATLIAGARALDTGWEEAVFGDGMTRVITLTDQYDISIYLGSSVLGESDDVDTEMLDQILTTFKFVDPVADYITSEKQDYTTIAEDDFSVTINFETCEDLPQRTFWVAFGSTVIDMQGITNDNCVMRYSGEVENPNWDGSLDTFCSIPTSLGKQTYKKGDVGVDFGPVDEYCTGVCPGDFCNLDKATPY